MLQRAASNAYSWWWASHIRTKQSKWLEQNLQDMEEKVQTVLKLISEDGDSFAKRAEMYYKKRPELIHFVEETYKMYRSLAERYDHISTELQNANNTIASVFPEQVQFAMDEEDDYNTPKFARKIPDMSKAMNIPKVPQTGPTKDLKSLLTKATAKNKLQPQRSMKSGSTKTVAKSGLSKPQGLEEIDKTQKQILSLQTEKEFVKNSYENGLAKYWEIENQIKGMQDKVSGLQDEFGEGMVIDDNEARNLMAAAALKSCQETLVELQTKQESTAEEAKTESRRVKDAKRNLESLKNVLEHGQAKANQEKPPAKDDESVNAEKKKILDEDVESVTQQRQKLEMLREKIKEHYEAAPDKSLTVTEMADKIDELVTKVISLESAVSSQTALVNRLRGENDEIHEQIRSLEGDKETLIGDKKELSKKLQELEDKLHQVQDLNTSVESQSDNLQTHFTEANCNLDHITHKLQTVRPDEEVNATTDSSDAKEESLSVAKLQKQFEVEDKAVNSVTLDEEVREAPASQHKDEGETADVVSISAGHEGESLPEVRPTEESTEHKETPKPADGVETGTVVVSSSAGDDQAKDVASKSAEINTEEKELLDNLVDMEATVQAARKEDEPDWQKLFANGMGDREKILLTEYTSTLRNYKELKKKFSEAENELFETSVQIKELKGSSAMKDEEIKALHKKLDLLLQSLGKTKDSEEFRALDQTSSMPKEKTENVETEGTSSKKSAIEEQFRTDIDELLEENLDFWLKFSASFHQVQQFETSVQDLQSEISKLEEKTKKQDGSSTAKYSMKSDARPLYKHLMEIQNELNVWLEKGSLLKDELQCRFASLCEIQEEITKALKTSAEDGDFEFTSYQAAKFQGEILNMKQENNKVADELQAGLDHVNMLQIEVERTLTKVNEDYKLAGSKKQLPPQLAHSESRSRVPLRSFIFGVAPKKQRRSFFAVMAPAMHKRYQDSKARSSSSQL